MKKQDILTLMAFFMVSIIAALMVVNVDLAIPKQDSVTSTENMYCNVTRSIDLVQITCQH